MIFSDLREVGDFHHGSQINVLRIMGLGSKKLQLVVHPAVPLLCESAAQRMSIL